MNIKEAVRRIRYLAENFQETPETQSTEDRNRQVVIPAPQVNELAAGGHNARDNAHHSQGYGASDCGGSDTSFPPQKAPDTVWQQVQAAGKHERILGIVGEATEIGNKPAPECCCCDNTNKPSSRGPSQALSRPQMRCVTAIKTAKCGCSGITPAQKKHTHDPDVLRKEPQDDVCAEKIPDHTIVSRDLRLSHERTHAPNIKFVDLLRAMAQDVRGCDRDKRGEEHWCDLGRLNTAAVEVERHESDRDVQKLSRDFMAMNETAIPRV